MRLKTALKPGLNLIDLTYFWNQRTNLCFMLHGLNLIDLTYFWNCPSIVYFGLSGLNLIDLTYFWNQIYGKG